MCTLSFLFLTSSISLVHKLHILKVGTLSVHVSAFDEQAVVHEGQLYSTSVFILIKQATHSTNNI